MKMFLSVLLGVVGCYISYAQNGYIVSTASRQANTFVESPEKQFIDDHFKYYINPAKRKATPIKNEKRFSEQKRKAMKIIKAILEIVSPLLLH